MFQEFDENEYLEGAEFETSAEELILSLGEALKEADERPAILNVPKMKVLYGMIEIAEKLYKGTPVRVTHMIHKPFRSMGSVTLEGPDVVFADSEWLARFGALADNMEAYPLTNGRIRVSFGFNGITKPLKEFG